MIYQTEETRERILAKAQEVFTEGGLFTAQMKDIATAVGISRTSLYRYFRDKEDLATAILGRLAAQMRGAWECSGGPAKLSRLSGLDGLRRYLEDFWLAPEFRAQNRYMAEFDAYYAGNRLPPDFRARIAAALGMGRDPIIAECIERGLADGSVRPGLEVHLASVTVLNAVRGLQQRVLLRGEALVELEPGEVERVEAEHLGYVIAGIAAKGEA